MDERDFIALIVADATVQSRLGSDGEGQTKLYAMPAPQNSALPYATYFTVVGTPNRRINATARSDRLLIQVDIFSQSKGECVSIYYAIRDAVESAVMDISGFRDSFEDTIDAHRRSVDFVYHARR